MLSVFLYLHRIDLSDRTFSLTFRRKYRVRKSTEYSSGKTGGDGSTGCRAGRDEMIRWRGRVGGSIGGQVRPLVCEQSWAQPPLSVDKSVVC